MPEKFYLAELRARKGLTQAQVASDLGISLPTYGAPGKKTYQMYP